MIPTHKENKIYFRIYFDTWKFAIENNLDFEIEPTKLLTSQMRYELDNLSNEQLAMFEKVLLHEATELDKLSDECDNDERDMEIRTFPYPCWISHVKQVLEEVRILRIEKTKDMLCDEISEKEKLVKWNTADLKEEKQKIVNLNRLLKKTNILIEGKGWPINDKVKR